MKGLENNAAELFRLMDEVCENGDAALPALEQYLQTQTDAPEIDTEASLKKFKADHKEFFVKPHRGRRLCYRVFVVAAAVFAAGTVFALATGHNPFDYAAMWDSETFGFFQSGHDDFETTEDGYTHFPDGTSVKLRARDRHGRIRPECTARLRGESSAG